MESWRQKHFSILPSSWVARTSPWRHRSSICQYLLQCRQRLSWDEVVSVFSMGCLHERHGRGFVAFGPGKLVGSAMAHLGYHAFDGLVASVPSAISVPKSATNWEQEFCALCGMLAGFGREIGSVI